jgi:hypothetical protein
VGLQTEVVRHAYVCDDCAKVVPAESEQPTDRPVGFFMNLYQVTNGGVHQGTRLLFFCDKKCLMNAMQYRLSSFMEGHVRP